MTEHPTSSQMPGDQVSLKEFMTTLLGEVEKRIEQKIDGLERNVQQAFVASQAAITKSEEAAERGSYITRTELFAGLTTFLFLAIGAATVLINYFKP